MKNGVFQPDLTYGAKRSAVRRMKVNTKHRNYNITELQHDWEAICDYFDGEGIQSAEITIGDVVAGEVPVEGFDDEKEERVKRKLQTVCDNLLKVLTRD